MTQTMRERLESVAVRTATVDCEGGYEVDNWPEVIDAILAELREPDEDMKDAEYAARRKPLRANQDVRYRTFTAMIDAVRSSKTTP